MGREPEPGTNADELAAALARTRELLDALDDDEQRLRRAEAVEQLAGYVALLRNAITHPEPVVDADRAFLFKLEFADGRWNVAEKTLTATPDLGDVVTFDDDHDWRIVGSQLVQPHRARKPPHTFYVCAPA